MRAGTLLFIGILTVNALLWALQFSVMPKIISSVETRSFLTDVGSIISTWFRASSKYLRALLTFFRRLEMAITEVDMNAPRSVSDKKYEAFVADALEAVQLKFGKRHMFYGSI